jgi:excinuclease ABC subunit C
MKDDKNHTYIKMQNHWNFITLAKTRVKTKVWKYFWPYTSGSYVKNSINLLRKIFGYWNSNIIFNEVKWWYELYNGKKENLESLDYYISKSNKSKDFDEEFSESIKRIENFLSGNYTEIVQILTKKMQKYAKNLKFEEAWKIKDYLISLQEMKEKQTVRDFITGDHDVINYTKKYGFYYIWVTEIRDSLVVW